MKIKTYIILTFILISTNSFSQANDTEALLYNVSIGGVVGTIGAIINKKPNEKTSKIIFKAFSQGALGGYLTFESKRVLRLAQESENWKLIWSAKLINAAGTSIKENTALNNNFYDRWHINIGFNRIEFETKDKLKINYKIMPIALIYNIGAFTQTKFDLNLSLKTGEFIFLSNNIRFTETKSAAITLPGIIIIDNNKSYNNINNYKLITHEIIHIYQSNDYSTLNTYYIKPLHKLENKSNFLKKINKWVQYDFHYLPLRGAYLYETKTAKNYYDNLFEHEAGYFSNTLNLIK